MVGIVTSLVGGVLLGLFQTFHAKTEALSVRSATALLLSFAVVLANAAVLITAGLAPYAALDAASLVWFAAAGAIHFVGGWMLIGLSQRAVGVGITGVLVGTTPVFTALVAWLALGETLSPKDLFGVALVVVGVGLASWK